MSKHALYLVISFFRYAFFKIPFNGKGWDLGPESHVHLTGLYFHGFIFCGIWLFFFDFYQNYMTFWPLTSSLSVERDFSTICFLIFTRFNFNFEIPSVYYYFKHFQNAKKKCIWLNLYDNCSNIVEDTSYKNMVQVVSHYYIKTKVLLERTFFWFTYCQTNLKSKHYNDTKIFH